MGGIPVPGKKELTAADGNGVYDPVQQSLAYRVVSKYDYYRKQLPLIKAGFCFFSEKIPA